VLKKSKFSCRISLLFVLLASLVTVPSHAASNGDLLHYYNLALKNDPQFRGAEYDTQAIRETLRQAYAGLLPKIYGDYSYTLTDQKINSSENQVYAAGATNYDSKSYGVYLTVPIFRYASFVSIGQANLVMSRSSLDLEKARQDLTLRVAEAYMDVLLSQDKLAAVKAEETAVDLHHQLAKEKVENGMAPITDKYDAEARLAAVKAQRVDAENVLNDSLQALTEICGVSALEVKMLKDGIQLTKPLPENIDNWAEAGLKQNLDILIQKLKAEVAEKEIGAQKSAHYPTIDFQADYINKDTKGSLFGGGSDTTTYDFLIKLNIPIYEGGITTSKTREAASLHQSALQALTKQNRAAVRKVRTTYNGVISAMTRVEKSVDAQKMVVEAKKEGFKAGLFISLAVLDAVQDLYKYKKEFSQARNDYILNSIRLKHAVGALKVEELAMVNTWMQE
jgi:outer membrane protein